VSSINFHTKEISVKIVYYGPGLCGKTTSLQTIYASLPEDKRPQLVSLATEVDRTIFFDFLPLVAYRIREFNVRLQLYTVPGQVFYNATRKLVLNGVDGIVFVADSQRAMKDSNLESLQNLEENLAELGLDIGRVPLVLQYNKRDLPDVYSFEEMETLYNQRKHRGFATIATRGEGLFEALKALTQLVISDLVKKGLGRKLEQPAAAPPQRQSPRSVEEAVSRAAAPPSAASMNAAFGAPAPAPSTPPASTGAGLWPPSEIGRLGERLESALRNAQWGDAVIKAEQLLIYQAKRWAAAEGVSGEDPVAAFLLTRGISPVRYRNLAEAIRATRAGHVVGRGEALGAFIVALEALW
jgi:mutual gliding-motility protein MglA